jgi:tRNA pseudouridine55 synthase
MDGLLVIDKPTGPTSHDVVARMRRVLGERRIGHTGTLDPAASGVLPLVLGRATRLARFLSAGDKRYEAVVRFGVATDTYDVEGTPVGTARSGVTPAREAIEEALQAFRGTFVQQPPPYSAKKIAGRRSYDIARTAYSFDDAPVLPAPVSVSVKRLEITRIEDDDVTLDIECSAGFYVRSLAHDLGRLAGVGAHLAALRRTRSAGLTLDDSIPLEFAERSRDDAVSAVVSIDSMLPGLQAVTLTDEGVLRAVHGRDIGHSEVATRSPAATSASGQSFAAVRLIDELGRLVAIAEPTEVPGVLHPAVVLR